MSSLKKLKLTTTQSMSIYPKLYESYTLWQHLSSLFERSSGTQCAFHWLHKWIREVCDLQLFPLRWHWPINDKPVWCSKGVRAIQVFLEDSSIYSCGSPSHLPLKGFKVYSKNELTCIILKASHWLLVYYGCAIPLFYWPMCRNLGNSLTIAQAT